MNLFQKQRKNDNIKKLSIAMIGIAMLFVVLFSAVFVSVETYHDCDGENCPICAVIQQCENNLRQLSGGLIGLVIAFFSVAFLTRKAESFHEIIIYSTPVSDMVRMNN